MKISVIIVHWNTPSELKVQSSEFNVKRNIEIILIDNNSTEENLAKLKGYRLQDLGYKIIYNKENLGFAKACNQGAKIAEGKWLLFLNPDTLISSENILDFVNKAQERNLDAASLEPQSGDYLKPLPSPLSLLVELTPLAKIISLNLFKKKTLFGGGLLIKRKVFEVIGRWDEDFFLWFEDSDITKRLVIEKFQIGTIKAAHTHIGGSSFKGVNIKRRRIMFFTSMNIYATKHFGKIGKLIVKAISWWNSRVTNLDFSR